MRDPGLRSEHEAEVQVGLLMLAGLVALLGGVAWIAGLDVGGDQYGFHVLAPEASQVSQGSRVYLRGVDVGSVRGVRLAENGVLLDVQVSGEVDLPADSRAVIKPSGFLGTQMVELLPGGARERLSAGDTLAGGTGRDLQTLASEMGGRAEDVLDRTARLLSDSTLRAVRSGADDLAGTLEETRRLVRSERETVGELLEEMRSTASNLDRATSGPELRRTVARLDSLAAELGRASEELTASSRSLASILDKADRGEGSLGKLVNDDRLYERAAAAAENLRRASEEITLLTKDLRENPRKYLKDLKFSVF